MKNTDHVKSPAAGFVSSAMKTFPEKARRFIDFCFCACFFPEVIGAARFLKIKGPTSIADKFFLYVISKNIPLEGDILEIGSFMGSSSILLAAGNELSVNKGIVWLIEPYPRPDKEQFFNVFRKHRLDKHIRLVDKASEEARGAVDSKFRFIFIDGNHEYEYVKKDILLWQECLKEGGIIAFHDYTLDGVSKAIDELIRRSDNFTILGNISGVLYAVKGKLVSDDLISRLNKLNKIREKCVSIAINFGLKGRQPLAVKIQL